MFKKYYEDELVYLRELGAEFAREHPAAAHMLAGPGSDPDVERLLEGFAFLSAKIRQRLDDELPEVTHGLMALLWPHYLQPIPAMTIVEFNPREGSLAETLVVGRGSEVRSVAVEGTPCRFRTAHDVVIHPISLAEVQLDAGPGPSRLWLRFNVWSDAAIDQLDLRRVRLYLTGDPSIAYQLHYHLSQHVREIAAGPSGPGDANPQPRRPVRLVPGGFAQDEALLSHPAGSFSGYRLLQEYFVLPEKFLCFDLMGLEALGDVRVRRQFWVEVRFDRPLDPNLRIGREALRLNCVPVVNQFDHEVDAFRVDHTKTEYRLRPTGKNPLHYEIMSLQRVTALRSGTAEEREVPSFFSFRHELEPREGIVYYYPRRKASVVDGRTDTYLSFVNAAAESIVPRTDTIAVQVSCTNRRLPEALRAGDIRVPTESSPEFIPFRNITVPTPSLPPPLEGDLHWRLLSHLALNHLSLTDVVSLRGILDLYNFRALRDAQAARANARRLMGIKAVRSEPRDRVLRGGIVRGAGVTLELEQDHFAGAGDLYLFASILNEFFALHASLNSFTQLTVRETQGGEEYVWPCKTGRKSLV